MSKGKKLNEISYSRLCTYIRCPLKWKLIYIDNLEYFKPSSATVFGSAMHDVLQQYLKVMYNETVKKADALNINSILKNKLVSRLSRGLDNGVDTTTEEMVKLYESGKHIIHDFKKKRRKYFGKRKVNLIGIELPLYVDIDDNFTFKGSLDAVIEDERLDKHIIYDFKTSYYSWRKSQKYDPLKRLQLQLYKKYFGKQYDISMKDIDVGFIILKKNIYEKSDWPQSRIQYYEPPTGKISMNKANKYLVNYITENFDGNGNLKDKEWKPKKNKYCKYCPFKNTQHCDR